MTAEPPPVPPWAKLITDRREALYPPVSRRQAAIAAGIAVSTLNEIENGLRQVAPGVTVAVRGTPDKLARIARFLEITPDELRGADREDAARHLEQLLDKAEKTLSERQKRMLGRKIDQDTSE